jgi:3-hydroxybutyryl-CoA dehydrogenase
MPHNTVGASGASIVVIGGGTMGAGIATSFLVAGSAVRLIEAAPEAADAALARVADSLERLARRDSSLDPMLLLERLDLATDHDGSESNQAASAVIEAVPEDMGMKQRLFGSLESIYSPDTLFASNTSSLSITEIARNLEHPARLIGMHFFNPVPVSELIEIVVGEATSDDALTSATSLAQHLGKTPIVVRDAPGFASSRLGVALGLEAIRMLEEEVASAEDIDTAMALGYRHPMGPLRLTDLIGLDVRLAIAEHLERELGPRFEPPDLLRTLVLEGKLGKKTGQGFYRWE